MVPDFFEGLMKNIKIRYSEEEIKNLATTLNWNGNGTENDPIIISSNEGLPQKFAFTSSNLFITILNCNFDYIIFSECKNITLENCSLETLVYIRSLNNLVKRCIISKLRFVFSYENSFNNCSISKLFKMGSEDNTFEDCTLSDKARKAARTDFLDTTDIMKALRFGVIIGGFITLFYVFFYIFNELPIGINVVLSVLIYIGFIGVYIILKKLQKKDGKVSSKSKSKKY